MEHLLAADYIWPDQMTRCLSDPACDARYACEAGGSHQLDVWHPCWHISLMASALKKVTVFLPKDLLAKAQATTGEGITPTIREALELLAAGKAYDRLRGLRGRVRFARDVATLREDRA